MQQVMLKRPSLPGSLQQVVITGYRTMAPRAARLQLLAEEQVGTGCDSLCWPDLSCTSRL